MVTDYVVNDPARNRLRDSAAGAYLDDFSEWLAARRYRPSTIQSYLRAAARFAAWVRATTGAGPTGLGSPDWSAYRTAAQPVVRRRSRTRRDPNNRLCGARTFVRFLRARGHAAAEGETAPVLLQRFQHWMRNDRGAAALTVAGYSRVLRMLVASLGEDTHSYTAAELRAFVLRQGQGWSHSKAETAVSAVRMFVRFLLIYQECSAGLEHAIPRVAGWSQASLPRYLSPDAVRQVLSACDWSTPLGARDRAVLLLLARLGLRAGDVAGLRLEDLDWAQGRLRVSGKTRREGWLPLPQDVGEAILHYLQTARPAVPSTAVFVITHAPFTPILTRQVSATAERAIRRSGIASPSLGAHVFRHSAATQWLREGMSFQTIGALLRHVDADTTALYAKVDIGRLRQIALPWPEEEPPC